MALMRWDPFTALSRLDTEFDDVVRRTFGAQTYQFVPPVEMSVEDGDVVITMEVPGVDVNDIDIEVTNGRLTISGERKDRREETRGKLLVRELRYGSFRRTFQLPATVSPDQIEADVDKGLLRIRIKNVTKQAEPRKISVHGAESPQQMSVEGRTGEAEQSQSDAQQAGSVDAAAGEPGTQPYSEQAGGSAQSREGDSSDATTDSSGQASDAQSIGVTSGTSDQSAEASRTGSEERASGR